jgi:hypothetical protein
MKACIEIGGGLYRVWKGGRGFKTAITILSLYRCSTGYSVA